MSEAVPSAEPAADFRHPELLVRAVRIHLRHAYGERPLPANRRRFAEWSEDADFATLLADAERLPPTGPNRPGGYALRVGNAVYPNMKICVHPAKRSDDPDAVPAARAGFVLQVDTHDLFELPPDSPEVAAVEELRRHNRQLAAVVEKAWTEAGLPTQAALFRLAGRAGDPPSV